MQKRYTVIEDQGISHICVSVATQGCTSRHQMFHGPTQPSHMAGILKLGFIFLCRGLLLSEAASVCEWGNS